MTCRILLTFFLIGAIFNLKAQDFSNKGKDFWISYPSHIDGLQSVMGIYITSDVNATGTIQVGPTATVPFTVTANQVTRKFLGNSGVVDAANSYVLLTQQDGVKTNAAIHVISDKPVVVYTHIIRSARSGACLALPTPVLGLDYIVPSYRSTGAVNGGTELAGVGEVTVVATQPNTVIEVTPSIAGRAGKPANVPFQITLPAAGDVYQFQGVQNADLSGTKIKSISTGGAGGCKPVAVFSATTWSAFGCTGASGGDNLLQQLFPTRTWGKQFITAPFINRPFDIYRVFVTDPATKVTVTNNGVSALLTAGSYNATGGFYEIITQNPLFIEGDKAISVVQYIISQNCKSGCSTNTTNAACQTDPEMVLLNPIEQTLNDITFFSAHQNYVPSGQTQVTQHYVNVLINKNFKSSVRIDNGVPNSGFVDIPGTNYSYLQENLSASSAVNPVHRITADTSFSAIVYGYGQVESYGYNGGTNVKDLYQFVTVQNQYATVDFPATCKNTPFNFSITLPYQATSLTWDFGNNTQLSPNASVVNNAPVPDSIFIRDNRTLYLYKLSQSYQFKAVGTYGIKVLANNPTPDGCSGIQEINYDVEVYDPPVADWSLNFTGCMPDTLHFSDQSNGNGRPVNRWFWDFGDNKTDSIKNPLKKYALADTFSVALRVITDIGCVADTVKPVIVSPLPVSKFGFTEPYCPNNNVPFSDSSFVQTGNLAKWYWNFGNGTSGSGTNNQAFVGVYSAAGTYPVSLQVESAVGCKSPVVTKNLVISPSPVTNFDLPGVCLPSGVALFKNLSTVADNSPLSYTWNFGDGGFDTAANPIHVYVNPGPYQVTMRATAATGCTKDSTITFSNIFAQPKASFTASKPEICVTDSIQFTDKSTALNNTITQWFWHFGDGSTSNLQNPVKKYAAGGSYSVRLYTKSAAGCMSDTFTLKVQIDSLPTAKFLLSAIICEGKAISFTDQSVANSGTINLWYWQFGDGTNATLTNGSPFVKTYDTAANYTIKLALQTDKGCRSDTLSKTITVHPQPVASFVLPYVCLSDAFAQFTDSSYIKSGPAGFAYAWNFDDPLASPGNANTSALKNPKHKYGATGVYNVSLAISTVAGCKDSVRQTFTVNGAVPKAGFSILNNTSLCSNISVSLQNKSTVDFGYVTRLIIIWDNQNAPLVADTVIVPAYDEIFFHKYPSLQTAQTYQVKVKAYSGGSCVSEFSQSITVNASPKVTIATIPGICLDAAARQLATPGNGSVAGIGAWTGTGVSLSGLYNALAADTGRHWLQYLYTSDMGCKDSAVKNITVWPSPTAKFGVSPVTCINGNISYTDSSKANYSNITQWIWNVGNKPMFVNFTNSTVVNQYNATGNYNVTLQVVTDSGCKSQVVPVQIAIQPKPEVKFSMPSICLPGGSGQFFDSSTIADNTQSQFSYRWKFGDAADTSSSISKNPFHRYSSTGPFNVQLTVRSNNNCEDSLTQLLTTVYPQPKANFTFSPTDTCLGGTFYFTDNSNGVSGTVTDWFWNFGDGSTSTQRNTSRKFNTAGTFNVQLYIKNQQNCLSDTITKAVIVRPYPTVDAGPDLIILEGGTAVIKAVATGSSLQYLWSPPTYLNNDKILTPAVVPFKDITYKLTVTAAGGCKSMDEVFVKVLLSLGVPNVFSPNGDGINDKWVIQYLQSYPGNTVEVFNRYGQSVFYSAGYNQPWDGTFKGSPLPVGVYYYIIDPKNGRQPYKGSVTILK